MLRVEARGEGEAPRERARPLYCFAARVEVTAGYCWLLQVTASLLPLLLRQLPANRLCAAQPCADEIGTPFHHHLGGIALRD